MEIKITWIQVKNPFRSPRTSAETKSKAQLKPGMSSQW